MKNCRDSVTDNVTKTDEKSVPISCDRARAEAAVRQYPGGVLPYKALMGTCGQPGYVFRDFCLEQGIKFIIFVLIRVTIYQFLS